MSIQEKMFDSGSRDGEQEPGNEWFQPSEAEWEEILGPKMDQFSRERAIEIVFKNKVRSDAYIAWEREQREKAEQERRDETAAAQFSESPSPGPASGWESPGKSPLGGKQLPDEVIKFKERMGWDKPNGGSSDTESSDSD